MHTCRAAPSFQITAGHGGAVPEPRRLPPSRPARVGPAQKPQQDELRWMEPTLLTGCGGRDALPQKPPAASLEALGSCPSAILLGNDP